MKNVKIRNVNYIINVISSLIENNIENGDNQSFMDWCEGGEIFDNDINLKEGDRKELYNIMQNIAQTIDNLSNKLIEYKKL